MGDNENRKVYKARQVKNYREMVEYSCKNYAQNIAYKYKKDYTAKNVEYIEKTYEQVGKDIKAFGTGLLNLDLMGERIVVVGKNRYEWCISYLATTCSNMVIVPIDKALPDIEMQRLIERSEAKAIIFDEKYLETIKKVQEKENSNLKTLICMDNIQEKGIKTFNEILEEGRNQIKNGDQKYDNIEIDENKMSIMLFTSGTTNEITILELTTLLNRLGCDIVETDLNTFKNNINKYTDEYTKEYLLGQNLNKYSQNLTLKDLEKAKLSWHKTDTEYIKKVIKVIKSL